MIDIPTGEQLLRQRDAMQAGLDKLQELARSRAPVLTGRLREMIQTRVTSSTTGEVYIRLIYAPKQERRTWQKHPQGGEAHFMSITFTEDADKAMEAMAAVLQG